MVKKHAAVAYAMARGSVSMDDLLQEGRIMMWKAVQSYDGRGTLEGYLHECLWRGYRDIVRGERRRQNVFDLTTEVEEARERPAPVNSPDARIMLNSLVRQYEPVLSTQAFMVLCEMVDPSPATMRAALATSRRRSHLKRCGVRVVGFDTVRLTPHHIARGTRLPLNEVVRAVREIKRTVRESIPNLHETVEEV